MSYLSAPTPSILHRHRRKQSLGAKESSESQYLGDLVRWVSYQAWQQQRFLRGDDRELSFMHNSCKSWGSGAPLPCTCKVLSTGHAVYHK